MTLPPGTRIPTPERVLFARAMRAGPAAYYRGLVEGITLGAIAGGLLSACALALAWAHMGG